MVAAAAAAVPAGLDALLVGGHAFAGGAVFAGAPAATAFVVAVGRGSDFGADGTGGNLRAVGNDPSI